MFSPHFREFSKYTTLNVLGIVGLSCYILADTFFVSKGLGTNGLAALNLAIPIYSFIHGSGLMMGMGGETQYSIQKIQQKNVEANRTFTHAVGLAVFFGIVFVLAGVFLPGPLLSLLGADGSVSTMAYTYLQVILFFAPAFLMNNVLLCFVRNDGAPQLAMAAMMGGSLSNIVLDWVFIFPYRLGIFGAAFATGLAPVFSMLILSLHFRNKNGSFCLTRCRIERKRIISILSCGIPSLVTEVSSGVVMIVFNALILNLEGTTGVAAYGVIANLSLVVIACYTGIAQGIQPLVSRYFGLHDQTLMQKILQYARRTMLLFSIILYMIIFLNADWIVGIFNSEQNSLLQSMAVQGLRLYFLACPFAGWNILLSLYFTSTQRPRPAHVLSLLRGFLLIIPTAFLLSWIGGIQGIWCAFPATELLVAIVAYGLLHSAKQSVPPLSTHE